MALMKLPSFARSVDYENQRNYNCDYITDVYDSESWKEQTQEEDSSDNEMDLDVEEDGNFICLLPCLLCCCKLCVFQFHACLLVTQDTCIKWVCSILPTA